MTQYQPSVSNLKVALLRKWYLIQNSKILCQIFKEPQSFHTKKGKSLKDLVVRAKLTKTKQEAGNQSGLSLLVFLFLPDVESITYSPTAAKDYCHLWCVGYLFYNFFKMIWVGFIWVSLVWLVSFWKLQQALSDEPFEHRHNNQW